MKRSVYRVITIILSIFIVLQTAGLTVKADSSETTENSNEENEIYQEMASPSDSEVSNVMEFLPPGETDEEDLPMEGNKYVPKPGSYDKLGYWYFPVNVNGASIADYAGCYGHKKCLLDDIDMDTHHKVVSDKIDPWSDNDHNSEETAHRGIDISNSNDDNIYAANAGKVVFVKNNETNDYSGSSRGNYVIIEHKFDDNYSYYSLYQHLKSVRVSKGDSVEPGTIIAIMGRTGGTIGKPYPKHLHFEMFKLEINHFSKSSSIPTNDTGFMEKTGKNVGLVNVNIKGYFDADGERKSIKGAYNADVSSGWHANEDCIKFTNEPKMVTPSKKETKKIITRADGTIEVNSGNNTELDIKINNMKVVSGEVSISEYNSFYSGFTYSSEVNGTLMHDIGVYVLLNEKQIESIPNKTDFSHAGDIINKDTNTSSWDGFKGMLSTTDGCLILMINPDVKEGTYIWKPYFLISGQKYEYDIEIEISRKGSSGQNIKQDNLFSDVVYSTHVQKIGWQSEVSNGQLAGTVAQSKRLEAIKINLKDAPYSGNIEYRTHVQSYGWQNWVKNGALSGTSGEAKRLEAIQIRLTGEMAKHYDVYYRVQAQTYGWLGWAKNGEYSGTAGYAKRLEAIQIVIMKKDTKFTGEFNVLGKNINVLAEISSSTKQTPEASYIAKSPDILYRTHVQSFGWQNFVANGAMSGTSGKAKRLEAIEIKLNSTPYEGGIRYKTHVQTYGWQGWKQNGTMSGTSGQAKRLEAISIELTGEMSKHYDIYYRVHAQTYGWLSWAKNGQNSGTAGYAKRLEGIQIVLVEKGKPAPGKTYNGITANRSEKYISK